MYSTHTLPSGWRQNQVGVIYPSPSSPIMDHYDHDVVVDDDPGEFENVVAGHRRWPTVPLLGRSYDCMEHARRSINNQLDSDGLKIVQRDGYNCGPIACMVLWKIFKPAMIDLKKIQQSQYRLLVVYELKRLLKIYRQNLVVFTKKPNENQVDLNTRLDDGEEADKKRRILPDRQARKTRK